MVRAPILQPVTRLIVARAQITRVPEHFLNGSGQIEDMYSASKVVSLPQRSGVPLLTYFYAFKSLCRILKHTLVCLSLDFNDFTGC